MWGMTSVDPYATIVSGVSGLELADSSQAEELRPDDAWVIGNRGETHLLLGRYEEALADFRRADGLDPFDPWVIANRGQTHLLMGRYQEALADFSRAAELDPSDPWVIAARGEIYRLLGRYEEAVADFSRAIELDPGNAWAITGRGVTYRQMGRYEKAVADFSRVIDLDPADSSVFADRGQIYRLMDRTEEALADLGRAGSRPSNFDQLTGHAPAAAVPVDALPSGQDKLDSPTPVRAGQARVAEREYDLDSLEITKSLPQGAYSPPRPRYLKGQCPESIPVGEPFSLLVSIVLAGSASAALKPFQVPLEGQDVLVIVHAPGLRVLSRQRLMLHVPADRDSEPIMFELRADVPGPQSVSVTAWLGGSYLGELLVEIMAERDRQPSPHHDVFAEIDTEFTDGAVSLVVRYDPIQKAYRFEFRDEDNPDEVTSHLAYEPGPRLEQLIGGMDEVAKGRTGYSTAETRDYLINAGAGLWRELVPERLRVQFWERQHRIRQLTILADKDTVPWELLYPMDPGYDAGFLVEQFPVTRAIFNRRPGRRLNLRPARFVLPEGSPPEAHSEIEAMRQLLDPEQPPVAAISALTPLQDLIRSADFGLLHFACHNSYNPADGSSIRLDGRQFTLTHMTTAAIGRALSLSAPTVFINACRSAGLTARYNGLDSWASKFLEAGAAAFIGSLWAVSDGTAREFATELYGRLQAGSPLGKAVMRARQVTASQPGDPSWLAYTVYGNPRATIVPDATTTGPRR
jgi:Flp pilus assembly protein TadD